MTPWTKDDEIERLRNQCGELKKANQLHQTRIAELEAEIERLRKYEPTINERVAMRKRIGQ